MGNTKLRLTQADLRLQISCICKPKWCLLLEQKSWCFSCLATFYFLLSFSYTGGGTRVSKMENVMH